VSKNGNRSFLRLQGAFAHMAADTVMGILTLSALFFCRKKGKKTLAF
jgi:hypothetical protein